ncbi:hypothetical protein DFH06DRAFT_1347705 [Mycena polygramma]|nr:hypothetical protein DFH06DRAFT_1347705 [Mycena polygramma]
MSNAQAIELVEYFMALAKKPDQAAFKFLSGDLPEEEISVGGSGGSGAQEGEDDDQSGGGDGKGGESLKGAGGSDGGDGNMASKGKTTEPKAVEEEAHGEEVIEEEVVEEEVIEEEGVEEEADVAEKSKKVTKKLKGKAKKVANSAKKSTGGAKAKTALAGGEGQEDETEGAHKAGTKRKRVTTKKIAEDGPPVKKAKKAVVAAEDPVAEGRPRRVRAPTKARAAPMSPLAKKTAAGKGKAPGGK